MNIKLILAVVIVGFLFAGCDKKEATTQTTQSQNGSSGTAKATNNYENAGISFQYPISWHSARSMTAMRTQLTNELRNFNRTLVAFDMFISSDEEVALLVSKVQTENALSTSDILSERGKVYDDATRSGDVTKINKLETTTVKNLPAVVEDVERSNGGRGHTVKLLTGRFIVELSLIVNNKAKYENHIGEYEEILASLKVQEETESETQRRNDPAADGVRFDSRIADRVMQLSQNKKAIAHIQALKICEGDYQSMMALIEYAGMFIKDDAGQFNEKADEAAFIGAVTSITKDRFRQCQQLTGTVDVKRLFLSLMVSCRAFVPAQGKFSEKGFGDALQNLDKGKIERAATMMTTEKDIALCHLLTASARFIDGKGSFNADRFNARLNSLRANQFAEDENKRIQTFLGLMNPRESTQ